MSDRSERLAAIFAEVCGLEPTTQRTRVRERCAGDAALEAELDALLARDAAPRIDFDAAVDSLVLTLSADDVAPAVAPDATAPIAIVDGFDVQRRLAEGGMGVVYLAEQQRPRRTVALKLIRPGMASPALRRRFEHEADILGRLQHPGIAQIFEVGSATTVDGSEQPYIAMEYVDGVPLTAAALRDRALADRVRVLVAVCHAVRHAHQHGVIHRDLKPSNILVSRADVTRAPKVLDFGIARTLAPSADAEAMTRSGEFLGTVAYMSPEQCAGRARDVDARADVYALGVIAYEVLSGQLPIETRAEGVLDAARRIVEEVPRPLGRIDPALRGDLERIVSCALAKDPAQRYQSASELGADLERWLRNEPIVARPPSAFYLLRTFARRHRAIVAAGLGLALTIIAGAITTTTGWRTAARHARAAEHERDAVIDVNDFLKEIFASVDPYVADGSDVRMRGVLDRATADLSTRFADHPRVRAELHAVVGRTYTNLGDIDAGRRHLEAARALFEADDEAPPAALTDVLRELQMLCKVSGAYREGLTFAERVTERCLQEVGAAHVRTLDAQIQEAVLLASLSEFDAARERFDDVLPRWRVIEPDGSSRLALALNEYGTFLTGLRELDAAEAAHRESLELAVRFDGAASLPVALAWLNLSVVLEIQGRIDEAIDALERGRALRAAQLDADHPGLTEIDHNEGVLRHRRGEIDHAARLLDRAVTQRRLREPAGTVDLALSLKALGDVRSDQAQHADAIAHFDAALEIFVRELGAMTMERAVTLQARSMAHAAHGDRGAAREDLATAIDVVRAVQGESSPALAAFLHALGRLEMRDGAYERAVATLREGQAMCAALLPDDQIALSYFDQNLGVALMELGQLDDAGVMLDRALERRRAVLPATHPARASTLRSLAVLARKRGDPERSAQLARDAREIVAAVFDAPHPEIAACLMLEGVAQREAGDAVTAEGRLRRALEMREALGHAREIAEAQLELGTCLLDLERHVDARRVLEAAAAYWDAADDDPTVMARREACRRALAECAAIGPS